MHIDSDQDEDNSAQNMDQVIEKSRPSGVAPHSSEHVREVVFGFDRVCQLTAPECRCGPVQILSEPAVVGSIVALADIEALLSCPETSHSS